MTCWVLTYAFNVAITVDSMLLVMSNTSQKACQQRSGLRNGMAKPPACLDAACGEGSLDVVQEI